MMDDGCLIPLGLGIDGNYIHTSPSGMIKSSSVVELLGRVVGGLATPVELFGTRSQNKKK